MCSIKCSWSKASDQVLRLNGATNSLNVKFSLSTNAVWILLLSSIACSAAVIRWHYRFFCVGINRHGNLEYFEEANYVVQDLAELNYSSLIQLFGQMDGSH